MSEGNGSQVPRRKLDPDQLTQRAEPPEDPVLLFDDIRRGLKALLDDMASMVAWLEREAKAGPATGRPAYRHRILAEELREEMWVLDSMLVDSAMQSRQVKDVICRDRRRRR